MPTLNMWNILVKVGDTDLVWWVVAWSGKIHALMGCQSSETYEKQPSNLIVGSCTDGVSNVWGL